VYGGAGGKADEDSAHASSPTTTEIPKQKPENVFMKNEPHLPINQYDIRAHPFAQVPPQSPLM
jgi:hypothetical protein